MQSKDAIFRIAEDVKVEEATRVVFDRLVL